MAEMNDIVKLAIDTYHGKTEKYSADQSADTLRQALIDLNGGSTKLNYKSIRDGKCTELFAIIEEILDRTVVEGLTNDDFFNQLVEYRNVALGDQPDFVVNDSNLFTVSKVSDGNQQVRRQRLDGSKTVTIPTTMHIVKIYEELNRVLAGRVDFNKMINKVSESYVQQILTEIYALWSGATQTDFGFGDGAGVGALYYPNAGSYSEATMLSIIEHVEAASGKPATIIGTKAGVRNLAMSVMSDGAKESLYNDGYYGKFYGTPVMTMPQRHKRDHSTFQFSDKVLTVFAGDPKPIKFVYEGEPIVHIGDPFNNDDLTQEYVYGSKWGCGLLLAGGNTGIGRYELT